MIEVPITTTPAGFEIYDFGILTDNISIGICREKSGYQIFFTQTGEKPVGYQTKEAPWLIRGIEREVAAFLKEIFPSLQKYSKEYLPSQIRDLMGTIREGIRADPQVASVLIPDNGGQITERIVSVTIYPSYDGAGGGNASYELEILEALGAPEYRVVSLSVDDMTSDSPTSFKKKWTSIFPVEFLEISKSDWKELRSNIVSRAIIKPIDHTGEIDSIIEGLLAYLSTLPCVGERILWGKNPNRTLLYDLSPEKREVVYVAGQIIQEYLKRNDLSPSVWLPKLSKECQKRGITQGCTKPIHLYQPSEGKKVRKSIRVWVLDCEAIGFTREMLSHDLYQIQDDTGTHEDESSPMPDDFETESEILPPEVSEWN